MHIAKYLGKLIGKPVVAKWMNFHKTGGGRMAKKEEMHHILGLWRCREEKQNSVKL